MRGCDKITAYSAVAYLDFELRRGPGFNLLAQPAFVPSVTSSFFTQNKGGGGVPLDPPLQWLKE